MQSLDLDTRQRAMLLEMGVRVWQAPPAADDATIKAIPQPLQARQVASTGEMQSTQARPQPAAAQRPSGARQPVREPQPRAEQVPETSSGVAPDVHALDGPALVEAAAQCQACGLCAGRKNTTLFMPTPAVQADWLVVGDPPDADEDRLGQPFVEQAGLLLDNMLKAVGASRTGAARQGAYLSNVVKCRPPPGSSPHAAELNQCAQYLQREIALVQPKVILVMGRFAAQLLLGEHPGQAAQPLGKQRGQVYRYRGIPVVLTYHPNVLLRASGDKAKAWADLCLAMDVLDRK